LDKDKDMDMDMDTWAACTPLARMGITPTRHPWPPACPAAPCRRETRPATAIRAPRSSGPAAAVLRLALCPLLLLLACCPRLLLPWWVGSRGAGQPHPLDIVALHMVALHTITLHTLHTLTHSHSTAAPSAGCIILSCPPAHRAPCVVSRLLTHTLAAALLSYSHVFFFVASVRPVTSSATRPPPPRSPRAARDLMPMAHHDGKHD
jgi:hypothetical protein